jgi:hypothetical protein
MAGFLFRLETTEGVAASPSMFETVVPNWRAGDEIPLGPHRTLRVVGTRDNDTDLPPVLIVEDLWPQGSSLV